MDSVVEKLKSWPWLRFLKSSLSNRERSFHFNVTPNQETTEESGIREIQTQVSRWIQDGRVAEEQRPGTGIYKNPKGEFRLVFYPGGRLSTAGKQHFSVILSAEDARNHPYFQELLDRERQAKAAQSQAATRNKRTIEKREVKGYNARVRRGWGPRG